MVPQTYPSILNPYTNMREMVVKQLASTSGLQRWVDYIPMKLATSTRPAGEQTTDADGFIAINSLQDTSSGVAFKDWVPVYFDSDATDAWVVSDSGYIPVGASGGAIAILQSFGSDAHVYLPGSSGAFLSGLLTNNYTDSNGSTGYSANDGVAGLVLDGVGVVGANIATTAWTLGAGWSNSPAGTLTASAVAAFFSASQAVAALTVGSTYKVRFTLSGFSSGSARFYAYGATQQNATYRSANGVYEEFFVASYANTGIGVQAGGSGFTGVISDISFQEVTGIHATQSTTANKPALRRGAVNLALYSNTSSAWASNSVPSPAPLDGQENTPNGYPSWKLQAASSNRAQRNYTVAAGSVLTLSYTAKSIASGAVIHAGSGIGIIGGGTLDVGAIYNFDTLAIASGWTATPIANGWIQFKRTFTSTTGVTFILSTGDITNTQAMADVLYGETQFEIGSTASTYSPTTSAPASNPNAGKYSWSFDGGDSLTLGSVPFQMSDDHCVIAGLQLGANSTTRYALNPAAGAGSQRVGSIYINASNTIGAGWTDDAAAANITSPATYTGQTVVASCVKQTNAKRLRVNGAQAGATDNTVMGTTTLTTGGAIGDWKSGGGNQWSGAIGPVILIKGTISDSDLLTLERWVASLTPNAPSF